MEFPDEQGSQVFIVVQLRDAVLDKSDFIKLRVHLDNLLVHDLCIDLIDTVLASFDLLFDPVWVVRDCSCKQ